MVSRVIPVDDFDLVIFGGTGDLARRKILPGLFRRFLSGQMPETSRVIGAARSDIDSDGYRLMIREAIAEFGGPEAQDADGIERFVQQLYYIPVDAMGDDGWKELHSLVRFGAINAFYFSVAPSLFGALAERLHTYK
ncbi:MAG: glucose-6-phosphate dehydrogenase, partial [Octadecabacter sp.]|nr:glucose-6-phosphate dehydrogenase [Octadecabacter sp.]